jgi:NAD(P)H-dependent FMN reductase
VSRPEPGEKPLAAFQGKVAALLSASPGPFGGLRGLVHVRAMLSNIGVLVLPTQVTVPKADAVLGTDGRITDAGLDARVAKLAQELVTTTQRLRA